jgi:NAD-dependent SIR2 family protein deacetylase
VAGGGYPQLAKSGGAKLIEINPEPTELSHLYDQIYPDKAGKVLQKLFDLLHLNIT